MKTIIFIVLTTVFSFSSFAQEFKMNIENAKRLSVSNFPAGIVIEATSGNELIIQTKNFSKPPERADGLKPLSDIVDNTQIGIQVILSGDVIEVKGATKRIEDATYTFRIPASLVVKLDFSSPFADEDIRIEGISNEIEIQALNPDIFLENITGPAVINAINGDINIVISKLNQDSPSSITAINGILDLSLPGDTKADLDIRTINGEVYTNLDIEIPGKSKDMDFIGGRNVGGKLNGGGVELKLTAINDNIYLRKK